ncbi:MAG TPA: M20/M25/M40 family metallo-hydrolase [Phototrophicaceae bacterium]|nr:M20/M25/M40 family metallo-hydrolase [Phototrophicaceae bacterium]
MKELIKKLVEAWGPSGYEHHVRELIKSEVMGLADEITTDPLGNLICRVGQGGKKIMIAAHMDEIGVMVTFAEKSGYLRFVPIGGLLPSTLLGNRVRFEDGTIGVIGVEDMWGESRTKLPDLDSFYIDVSNGSGSGNIEPGCPAGFWRDMEERGSRLVAKSMDDRIACAIAIETMRRLNKNTPNEVYFVFTVQEEVGIRGARPAAFGINPDVAVALDVTATGDEIKNAKMTVKLGGGAAIKLLDMGLVVPPAVRDWMVERAQADGIPYQLEMLTLGSTDAAGIQLTRAGVPSGCISIPCRFVHTVSETVDLNDVQACVGLLSGLLSHSVPF